MFTRNEHLYRAPLELLARCPQIEEHPLSERYICPRLLASAKRAVHNRAMITVDLETWGTIAGIVVGVVIICGTVIGGLFRATSTLGTKIDATRTEAKADNTALSAKLDTRIDALDTKIDTKIDGLRGEFNESFAGLRSDVKTDIAGVRSEIQGMRVDISALADRVYHLAHQGEPRSH